MIQVFENPNLLYKTIKDYKKDVVLTLGTFDGLHIGHQEIIKKVVSFAKSENCFSVVYTFKEHPKSLLKKVSIPRIINPVQKIKIISELGVNFLILRDFWQIFSYDWREFWINEIAFLPVKKVVVGFDFHFGKGALGHREELEKLSNIFDFDLIIQEPVVINGEKVSSTKIRELIKKGNIEEVNLLLGRPYRVDGIVIPGDKFGRILGYPTANIKVVNEIIPKKGVYVANVYIGDNKFEGICYIGSRPTLNKDNNIKVEVYIFDLDEDLYNRFLEIEFLKYIREDIKFDSIDSLKKQIEEDVKVAKRYFDSA